MLLLVIVLIFIHVPAKQILGINRKDAHLYSGSTFSCKSNSNVIKASFVNDDYCDCEDGSDEPGTSACVEGRFYCQNKGFQGKSIPSLRVNDGICDCCDGSDEYKRGPCQNNCKELAKVTKEKSRLEAQLHIDGSEIKEIWIAEAAEIRRQWEVNLTIQKKQFTDLLQTWEYFKKNKKYKKAIENINHPKRKKESGDSREKIETKQHEAKKKEASSAFPYPKRYQLSTNEDDKNKKKNAAINSASKDKEAHKGKKNGNDTRESEIHPEDEVRITYGKLMNARDSIINLKRALASDYGERDTFLKMYQSCITYQDREYTYKVCPYHDAKQEESSSTILGRWRGLHQNNLMMVFERGEKCWKGPPRSLYITLKCGLENKILNVDEPDRCVYTMIMQSPVACSQEHAMVLLMNVDLDISFDEEKIYS